MAVRWYVPSFGYPVTRPYPYKWFPWVVLIGGISSLVLFSAINLAANGYELEVQYTPDPNSTLLQPQWANQWPFSWFSKFETTCQSQTLQIDSPFYTDKLGLPYTLANVWQNRITGENTDQYHMTVLPSLRYTNNLLENCTVGLMDVSLDSSQSINASFTDWKAEASVSIDCFINNDDTPTGFTLTTNYAPENSSRPLFLPSDNQTKANLSWGRELLFGSHTNLTLALAEYMQVNNNSVMLVQCSFFVYLNFLEEHPISSPLFFAEKIQMTCVTNNNSILSAKYPCPHSETSNLEPHYLDYWPDIFPAADKFAKVLYSTILADLGSSSSENILTNASLLQEYDSYTFGAKNLSSLKIAPSTIYAEYFCQVPRRKPLRPLIVAIFVADLVFLQAAYKILTWTTTAWTERDHHQAKFCEGCLANMERDPYELSLAAPTDAAQQSSPVSSETWGRSAHGSRREHRRSSESQHSLVVSADLSE